MREGRYVEAAARRPLPEALAAADGGRALLGIRVVTSTSAPENDGSPADLGRASVIVLVQAKPTTAPGNVGNAQPRAGGEKSLWLPLR